MRRPILQGAIKRRNADHQTPPVRIKKTEEVGVTTRSAHLDVTRYSTATSGETETSKKKKKKKKKYTEYNPPTHFKDYKRIHQSVQ